MDGEYYQVLLREIPKGELARAASRRIANLARNFLSRRPKLDTAAMRTAFGASEPDAWVSRVLSPRRGWSDISRRSSVLLALKQIPGATERALERARKARERTFDVFGQTVRFGHGTPIDWSLDPQSGYRFSSLPSETLLFHVPGVDPKSPWVIGRLDCLLALGQGYWVADDQERGSFAEEFVRQTEEFLDQNPVGVGIQWASPMEVALRAGNLAQALVMFRDAEPVQDVEWLMRVMRALAEHQLFIEEKLEERMLVPNNHLLTNLLGLWTVGLLFPELPSSAHQVPFARRRLTEEFLQQVHPDGCSFEGSIPYHRLTLEIASLAQVMASMNGMPLGSEVEQRMVRMFSLSRTYCSEHSLAPQIGDNDSGRIFPLRDRVSLDHGYLAPLGAAMFGKPELKDNTAELPDEAAWLLGHEGLQGFRALAPTPTPSGFSSREGGMHVLRVGDAVLTVSAGRTGQRGVGGHSHNDKLSFEMHLGGTPVIVDPGTATYSRDLRLRNFFRSARAHNTVQVDGLEQSYVAEKRPFALLETASTVVVSFGVSAERGELTASYDGYDAVNGRIRVERSFTLDGPARTLTLADWLDGRGVHDVRFRLHFPNAEARLRPLTDEDRRRVLAAAQGNGSWADVGIEFGPVEKPLCLVAVESAFSARLESGRYSPGYGEQRVAMVGVWGAVLRLPVQRRCVVLFGEGERYAQDG